MTAKLFFENKESKKRYEVVRMDKSTDPPTLTLKSDVSVFTEPYDKEKFAGLGYHLVKVEDDEESNNA